MCRATLDDPALIGADVWEIGRVECVKLEQLLGQPLATADRTVGVDDLDALPAVALIRFQDRPDFDLESGLFADLSRERILQSLARRQKPPEETPFGRPEAVAREDHMATRIDPETHDADEKSRLGTVEDAPLPPDGEGVVEDGE